MPDQGPSDSSAQKLEMRMRRMEQCFFYFTISVSGGVGYSVRELQTARENYQRLVDEIQADLKELPAC